jgi:adenylate cyclase
MTDEDEAIVLVSEAVLQSAGSSGTAAAVGQHVLRGRREATTVFRLLECKG